MFFLSPRHLLNLLLKKRKSLTEFKASPILHLYGASSTHSLSKDPWILWLWEQEGCCNKNGGGSGRWSFKVDMVGGSWCPQLWHGTHSSSFYFLKVSPLRRKIPFLITKQTKPKNYSSYTDSLKYYHFSWVVWIIQYLLKHDVLLQQGQDRVCCVCVCVHARTHLCRGSILIEGEGRKHASQNT